MFRRSRFSIRPNVGAAGRATAAAAAAPQEAPSTTQEAGETPKDVSESSTPTTVTETKTAETPSEKPSASGDGNDQTGEGPSSSAAVQRRKRFSVKPKVAPGRPSAVARTPKSPVKAISETPVEAPGSDLEKTTATSQTGTASAPQGLQSPKRRRASGESKQPRVQPPTNITSSDSPGLCADPVDEDLPEPTNLPTDSGKQLESKAGKQVKDVPPRPPNKVPPSLPDKEAVELSEKAKTLVSSKSTPSISQSPFSLSRLLNDPSDLQRLAKAQKLRDLLRQERNKEKRLKQAKAPPREFTLDPTKMTMRDLIRYLPQSNPMSSSLDQSVQEETVLPSSPDREESPERAQEPEVPPKVGSPREEEEAAAAAAAEAGEEEGDGEGNGEGEEEVEEESLMVPQVKVAEDGTLIIDEASLTVEVQRANKSNPAQDRDPIFERGSTTTYSSFRKGTHSKPWSTEETDMFFLAISMVGTDFSMICQLFPHRARSEIKNKFKKEERGNSWRVDKAFRERRNLDIEYFSKLLEKVLEVQQNRKKLKKLSEKNTPKKRKRKPKAKKKLSDEEEEEDDDDEHESPDLEGEKENEDLCNEGASPVSKPKRQRKRKTKKAAVKGEEPTEKKKKSDQQSSEQGEVCMPEDAEATLPEDQTSSDITEKTENVKTSKDSAIKPAKLSRGRAPKPLLPLGRKWGKKAAPATTEAKGAVADEEDESASVEVLKEQESRESSPSNKANKKKSAEDSDSSSDEEDVSVQPPKPTRYGRVPKRTNLLNYPGKEDAPDSPPTSPAGSTAPAAKPKPKCSGKRGRPSEQKLANKSKKPKLVTLRASQLESSDEEDGKQWDAEEAEEQPACSSSKDSVAPAFVPICLRSPQPVLSEVEETMEELDILANMPDVLGISQDSMCPDASCERAQNDTGTPEPCEHQLDLLVDVIDFLSSEHTGVAEDRSYNEAAQTLLTIGNLTHLSQSAQSQTATQDHTSETSENVIEATQHAEEGPAPKPAEQEENTNTLVSGHEIKETPATDATVESQSSTTDSSDVSTVKTSDQLRSEPDSITHVEPSPQVESGHDNTKKNSPLTRRGRLPTVKPKPNLGRASRSAKTKSSPGRTVEETNTETHNLDVTESPSALDESSSKILECSPSLLMDDAVSQETSGATTSDQSHDSQSEPSGQQTISDIRSTSESSDGKMMSATEAIASSAKSNTSTAEGEVSQQGEVASTCQSRRSRLQKVKPKPNIPQTSRTARSTPKTTQDSVEKGSSQNVDAASSSLGVGSTLTPTREQSAPEENRTDVGQVCPVVQSRDTGSTLESTHDDAGERRSNLVTCVSPVTESQVGQDVAAVQESGDQPGEDLPETKKAESEVASTCQSRRSRLQKVKPKPNLPRTSRAPRSAPQITKNSSPGPTSEVLETPKVEVETEAASGASNEKPSQSEEPVSVLIPSINVDPTTEEQRAGGVGLRVGDQSASENQSLSQDLFEQSSRDAVSAGTTLGQTTESNVDLVTCPSQVGQDTAPVQESSDQPATPVQDLPDTQKVETKVMSAGPTRRVQSQKVKPKPNLAPTTRSARSKAQTAEGPVEQSVEGHPSPTSRSGSTDNTPAEAEAQPDGSGVKPSENSGSASGSVPSCTSLKPAGESTSAPTAPQRRRHCLKVKPNLGSPIRATQTKVQPKNISKPSDEQHEISERASADDPQPAECSTKSVPADPEKTQDGKNKGASSDSVVVATSVSAKNQRDSLGDKMSYKDWMEAGPSSRGHWVVDLTPRVTIESNTQPLDVPDVQSSKESPADSKAIPVLSTDVCSIPGPEESSLQPSSQGDSEVKSQDAAEQRSETRELTQTSNDKSQSSFKETELADSPSSSKKDPPSRRGRLIKPKPNLGRSLRPPQPHQVQSTAQAEADSDGRSEDVDASASHNPAPELQCDVQEPVEGAVEPHSSQEASANDSGSLLGCLTEIIEQLRQSEAPANDAGSSMGCVTQVQDNSSQNMSTLSLDGSQPSLSLFPDMLSEQVTSDPDEPFFILSLTEIPVRSSGQEVDSAEEPLPYLPLADASIQQHSSDPGESLPTVGEEGSLPTVPVSDLTAYIDSITEKPVDPHAESTTTVQPPTSSETVEKTEETEIPSEQRPAGAARRGKPVQVKASATRKEQPSKSRATKTNQDSELPEVSMQPEASDETAKGEEEVVTELQERSGDHVSTEKESQAGGKDIEDPGSGAQTRTRKTRACSAGNSSGLSTEPSPGKAASRGSKVKTPRTTRKRSAATPTPVASTSHNATSTPIRTQLPDDGPTTAPTASPALTEVDVELTTEHHHRLFSESSSSSSQCATTEVSLGQQSECVEEEVEEPTSVSQYFLSDIFTEVEEG